MTWRVYLGLSQLHTDYTCGKEPHREEATVIATDYEISQNLAGSLY